jgi:predicted RNase H-like HicB family nuclease
MKRVWRATQWQKGSKSILITILLQREDDLWGARCLELGTAVSADSPEKADELIDEAISLHLNALEELGERRRFFKEHGIHVYHAPPKKKPPVKRVDVPPESLVRRAYRELVTA